MSKRGSHQGGGGYHPSAQAKAHAAQDGAAAPVLQGEDAKEPLGLGEGSGSDDGLDEAGSDDSGDGAAPTGDEKPNAPDPKQSDAPVEALGATPRDEETPPDATPAAPMDSAGGNLDPLELSPVQLTVGQELTCHNFDGGLVVRATVREVALDGCEALLSIPALGRNWPIRTKHVTGATWAHHPEEYPSPGEDAQFDLEFRPPVPAAAPPAPRRAGEPFTAPRSARIGYIWAVTTHHVAAAGFDVQGKARRDWPPNEVGEFRKAIVAGSPQAFRTS